MGKKNVKKKSEKQTQKPKSKKYFFIIPVIIIICIIGLVLLIQNPQVITTSDEAKAQLVVETGTVEVKTSGGEWSEAVNGTFLYQLDSVKTGDNSSALVILFESSIIRLDSNTEIMLQELIQEEGETSVKISQEEGRTWNTVLKMSGIDDYEVQTPTTVASVRGTTFDINVQQNGTTIVSVIKGMVNVTTTDEGTEYTVELSENWSITVEFDSVGQPQPFEIDDWIQNNLLKDDTFKEQLKDKLYSIITPYIPQLKSDIGMTDEEIEILIDGFIRGDFTIPPNTPDEFKELFDFT